MSAEASSPPPAVASPKWKDYIYKPGVRTCWRGIYHWEDEEDEEWKQAIKEFPYQVPSFETEEETMAFMTKWCRVGSNRDERNYMHIFTLLTSWDQVEKMLLSKITWYDEKLGPSVYRPLQHPDRNVWLQGPPEDDPELGVSKVVEALDRRMNIPFHRHLSAPSTLNTLKYLFEHMRAGIFVKIKAQKLCMFVPFANANYRNTWGNVLEFDSSDGTYETYQREKRLAGYRYENTMKNVAEWWANGNVVDNERCKAGTDRRFTQEWGDYFLCQLREMLEAACRTRDVADCEFFINKRDYPHLKVNHGQGKAVEPYGFIYGRDDKDPSQDLPLARHAYSSYAPIASFYISDRFADIPWPTTEDWEAATGRVYPTTFQHKFDHDGKLLFEGHVRTLFTEDNFRHFADIAWEDKVATAFFRGTATGGGTKIENNQRLKLANLHHVWDQDDYQAGREEGSVRLLDAKLVGWNLRDKKIASEPMTYLRKKDFPFNADRGKNFVPIYEQARYKYLVYVEGHCAACRYSFLMRLGSVILKVESQCVADQMWYFPLLRPYVDHVPVKADLSDLEEKIEWCRDNDEECQRIAERARELYDVYCAQDGILDYLEVVTHRIAQNWRVVPDWWERPPTCQPYRSKDGRGTPDCKCPRCVEDKHKEAREVEERARAEERRKRQAQERWEEREKKRKLARSAVGLQDGEEEDQASSGGANGAEAQQQGEEEDEDAMDEHRD